MHLVRLIENEELMTLMLMKRSPIIILLTILILAPVSAQTGTQDLKREVTLYNPYKPSLAPFRKKSFLAYINDTSRVKPDFQYDITIKPFLPEYTISPIKAASLLPDPLPKLYKSYVNLGIGNYITPLAELSITNERSKRGAVGFYARHFSTNGKVKLQNEEKVFAGYMDNDASLFGRKFFRHSCLEGSIDYSQRTRYAYGYDTSIVVAYEHEKKDIRLGYNNLGADLSFASLTLDSTKFLYNFDANYDFFFSSSDLYQHNAGLQGTMSTLFKGFYAGSDIKLDFFIPSKTIYDELKYIVALSPFVKKSTSQWNFKAGLQVLLDKNMNSKPDFHLYPDVRFGFSVVPEYISFFAGLNGKLEVNEPKVIIDYNPFLINDGRLFKLANTDNSLIVTAGLNGNTGIGGNYLVSASYSMINNMLFFSNFIFPLIGEATENGNHFVPLYDDGELFNIHGEFNGKISDKITYSAAANFYKYTLTNFDHAWNKPDWDSKLELKYNLRDKIIAGLDVAVVGKRYLLTTKIDPLLNAIYGPFPEPVCVNFNLSAEYRYTKILSFWFKLDNISFNRYYEWAYYPAQRFIGLIGFTYSL
jgi:hypothetical protein